MGNKQNDQNDDAYTDQQPVDGKIFLNVTYDVSHGLIISESSSLPIGHLVPNSQIQLNILTKSDITI
jgi:hypothetical protein